VSVDYLPLNSYKIPEFFLSYSLRRRRNLSPLNQNKSTQRMIYQAYRRRLMSCSRDLIWQWLRNMPRRWNFMT